LRDNKKSGGRLYQGARSQACPEPCRRARIPGVVTVEAPGHPIFQTKAALPGPRYFDYAQYKF